jgi:tRNA threonylcarbamoyladenosine biosynthesis protein TsaE
MEKSKPSGREATSTSDRLSVVTTGERETIELGKKLGRLLGPQDVVAVIGELGSGKTRFIKGLAAGAGVTHGNLVVSPTYTLINEYPGTVPFYHIDAYRLNSARDLLELGVEEYLFSKGITVIEWADRAADALPESHLRVTMTHVSPRKRKITIEAHKMRGNILKKLRADLQK